MVLLPITAEGFGFSVAGSTDKPNMPIIVAQVVPDSPASFPYALQVRWTNVLTVSRVVFCNINFIA